MKKSVVRRACVGLVLVCMALAAFALPAMAATGHSIAGKCRNDATWYTSTNVRTVQLSGTTIRASFNDLCCKPMYFRLVNAKTGGRLGRTIVASGYQQTMATSVLANTQFLNAFRLAESCWFWQDRSFAGIEWY